MWKEIVVFLISWVFFGLFQYKFRSDRNSEFEEQPLYLTPYLETGNISEAQELSRVKPDIGQTISYSGYFTVNKECESNLFFWFFPAQNDWENAPVMLWVQGGPGASSMMSLFEAVGPLTYNDEDGLGRRQYSWNFKNNLLFIDQPVGTGFSFSKRGCYAKNNSTVGTELYSSVVQFYQLFPELRNNKFFIAGHSYAGHFIPALGHEIHVNNPLAEVKINLSGMMIGNGWMDILYQSDYGSYLYQLGLVDETGRDAYYRLQGNFTSLMENHEWEKAYPILSQLIGETYNNFVGNVSIYNYLKNGYNSFEPYENFIQAPEIRNAIHVGNTNFSFINPEVSENLGMDPIYTVKPWVEELLEHYFIVFYTGQLDVITGYPMVVNFLEALDWSGKEDFARASRHKWCVEGQQAGYFKGAHNLYDVFVRDAGHIVPSDQPLWAYMMMNSVTSGSSDNPLHALNSC